MSLFSRQHRSCRQRGFSLMEMLLCLLLMTIAMAVGTRLFGTIMRSYREAPAAARQLSLQTQWLAMLRADAWSARDRDIHDGSFLTLVTDSAPTGWRQEANVLIRESGPETLRWPLVRKLTWTIDDEVLTVDDGESSIPLATPALQRQTP